MISEIKKEQRKTAIQKRQELSLEERQKGSVQICRAIEALPFFSDAKCIFSYFASYDEADPSFLNLDGKKVCYPISYADGIMKAAVPIQDNGLVIGRFGIKSPDENTAAFVDPKDIDLVIVPCVAFDENKKRLGHGKGYYDRYLKNCTNAHIICIAFEAQKLGDVATDEFDIPMECIVTEKKIY